jgi:hypothetical protein
MGVLLISVLLGVIPLLGIVYILWSRNLTTVDGLFMSLILLTMSGIFFLNVFLELRSKRAAKGGGAASGKPAKAAVAAVATGAAPQIQTAGAAGEVRTEAGVVVDVRFFEAPVGQSNKSFVTFRPNGTVSAHVIVLMGDLRNALPAGKHVKITYTAAKAGNQLVATE